MANNIKVLTTESVEELRYYLPQNPQSLISFDQHIIADLGLSFVPTGYQYNDQYSNLVVPVSRKQAGLKDGENCKLIVKFLPSLAAADATDERLWVTLSLLRFREYTLARWPIKHSQPEDQAQHILSHWFCKGVRGRMRDNAISRLWWMSHIAQKIPGYGIDEVFDILFFNSDYRSSILERNSLANAENVTAAILQVTKTAYDNGIPFIRERFRTFMKEVDIVGGRLHLAALNVEQIVELLQPIYLKAYRSL